MRISPETHPIILGHEPIASNAITTTCDWIHLADADGVLITILESQVGGTTDLVLDHVHQGTVGSGTTALTAAQSFMIWENNDCTTSDTMVRQSNDFAYTIDAANQKNVIVQVYISAATLTTGYKWLQPVFTGGHAGNFAVVFYQLDGGRYQQTTPPTAIA